MRVRRQLSLGSLAILSILLINLYSGEGQLSMTVASTNIPSAIPTFPTGLPLITLQNANHLVRIATLSSGNPDEQLTQGQWSPDGKKLAAIGEEGIWIFSAEAMNKPPILLKMKPVSRIAFSNNSALLLAIGGDGTGQLWDVITFRQLQSFGPNPEIDGMSLSPDAAYLVYWNNKDSNVWLWNVATAKQTDVLESMSWPISFSPDSSLLAVANIYTNAAISLYDLKKKNIIGVLKQDEFLSGIHFLEFSPDGSLLLVGVDDSVFGWDMSTKMLSKTWKANYYQGVTGARFSNDGKILVTWGRTKVYLWQTVSEKTLFALGDHGIDRVGAAFHPDGTILITWDHVAEGDRVRLWDTATGQQIAILSGQTFAQFNLSGTMLVSSSDAGTVELWAVPQ